MYILTKLKKVVKRLFRGEFLVSLKSKNVKLLDVAMAALFAAPNHQLNVTVLNKILFYADLVAFRDLGETLTKTTYVALRHGPVVAKYQKQLIDKLENLGIAKQTSRDDSKPVVLCPNASPPSFDENQRNLIERVTKKVVEELKTSTQCSEYSHSNLGWELAYNAGQKLGLAAKPINMHIALQQIIEDDPWLDTPLEGGPVFNISKDDPTETEW